ncbi:MAG: ADP-ribosylglycohydrolase family protein, partial [Eggerthellaceae bacterium]|nr:ADP-ribosylglycohydrolase family protein [Eggerthellaceae bacterium]
MRMMAALRDAIYGLAVGDALGVPVEFKARGTYEINDMIGYGSHGLPAGTYSDDTAMALATCDSIRECGCRIDPEDMRRRFNEWLNDGKYAIDGHVFDVGNTVAEALEQGSGLTGISSNGNGSLMRIIPLAFVKGISNEQIEQVSAITHAHSISVEGCIL